MTENKRTIYKTKRRMEEWNGLLSTESEDFLYGFNEDEANRELAHLNKIAKDLKMDI